MAKIHLTGANGYIGSLLNQYLLTSGHKVEKSAYRLPNIPPRSIDADIVIHLAFAGGGTTHKPRKGDNDSELMKNINIKGIEALLSGIKNSETKILFISSTAVYGKFADSPIINEDAKLIPLSLYGKHKLDSELILKKSNYDWMILRPCGVFGPSKGNSFGNSFLNTVVANAIKKRKVTILGGKQKIDTLYLPDLIHIILLICSGNWHSHETFNVAGKIVTVEKMITTLVNSICNLGFGININKINFEGKPSILTNTDKLRQAFPQWDTTPLKSSMHNLACTYLKQKND